MTQRSVDVGQTVAASMSAPTLFVIAADLTEMQVNANIDEADVGRIRPGQHVTFRVDAYPTDNFVGTVTQIRLQPVVVQNVTTYGTVITVPNRELKLKPGMTANVKIEIAKRTNALRIPNAALRFRPTAEVFAALNQTPPPEATRVRRRRAWRPRRVAAAASGREMPAGNASPRDSADAGAPIARRARPSASARAQSGELRRDPAAAVRRAEAVAVAAAVAAAAVAAAGGGPEFQARMLERFKTMSPDEQTAVHRAHEGARRRYERVRSGRAARPAKTPRAAARARRRRRSMRCLRRCRRSNRAGARGCSSTAS